MGWDEKSNLIPFPKKKTEDGNRPGSVVILTARGKLIFHIHFIIFPPCS